MSVNNETFNNGGIIAWNCNSSKKGKTDTNFNDVKDVLPKKSCCDVCEFFDFCGIYKVSS